MSTNPRIDLAPQTVARIARASVFASAGATLGVVAHRLAGGALPGLPIVALATIALFVVGVAAAGQRRGRLSICALVLLTQAALHLTFDVTASKTLTGLATPRPSGPMTGSSAASAAAHMSMPATHMAAMIAMHLAAALIMAWWLASGERRLRERARLVIATARVMIVGFSSTADRTRDPIVGPTRGLRLSLLAFCVEGRAPPIA